MSLSVRLCSQLLSLLFLPCAVCPVSKRSAPWYEDPLFVCFLKSLLTPHKKNRLYNQLEPRELSLASSALRGQILTIEWHKRLPLFHLFGFISREMHELDKDLRAGRVVMQFEGSRGGGGSLHIADQ